LNTLIKDAEKQLDTLTSTHAAPLRAEWASPLSVETSPQMEGRWAGIGSSMRTSSRVRFGW
jgi:hypothetical protein